MAIDLLSGGNVEPRGLEEEMRASYLDYAMSVIVGRALPDVRDGLKPVHRRVLYAMYESGLQPGRPYVKCARIVGDVMGKYHPHGDSAIYDTLVRLAQDFAMRNVLIDGQGNFGSVDDDPAAAMRYTEARLAPLAREMLRDLDAHTVDFQPNYDGRDSEPTVLPARFPNLLVNGSSGIAVGMATNIPPHNLREAIAATIAYIDDPEISTEGLMKHLKGPDFPTAGVILGVSGIREAYETGRGRVRVRARAHSEPLSHGKEAIIVTELPFMVKKGGEGGLVKKIADLVTEKKLSEISDIRDESDRHGMRIVIELKREAIPKVVLNKLYKHTPMQTTFGVNMVALVDNVPRTLPLRSVLHNYVRHQRDVVVRRAKYELDRLERRKHILEGQLIALDHLDDVIALIRSSQDRESARAGLIERFGLSMIQAQAILELRLSQLTALEADSIRREHAQIVDRIEELRTLLGDESAVLALIKEEMSEIAERYGDERRTQISFAEDELDIEDLIADQQMVIAITKSGYIKRLALDTYRQQRRGGVGVTGMDMKEEDYIEHLFVCSTHDYLLFFTNRGKVYRSKVYELPEASRTAKGRYLGNVLPLREAERVQSVLATRDFAEAPYVIFATRNGIVKKTELGAYNTPIKADGIIAINIRDEDELVAVRRVEENDEILMVSRAGLTVRFSESEARAMGRDTSGVRGMDVGAAGEVIAMDVARDDYDLLVVTENGYGKRTQVREYRKTSRGAKGVKTIQQNESKGALGGALVVREYHDLVFISRDGMVQRTSARGINRYGRSSQGVRLMNLRGDDVVSAVAVVVEPESPPTVVDQAALASEVSAEPIDAADDPAAVEAMIVSAPETDDPTLIGEDDPIEGVIAVDAEEDSLLLPPELEEDEEDTPS
ncbi:MAG: DNA gyrase subunit A [Actinomycetota bacterium]|nr:DNA gyrase subunit A [Actinomycetota bacterium]